MPIPIALGAAAIGAGGSLLAGGINAAANAGNNKKSRQFTIDRYNVERQNAINDRQWSRDASLSDWAMQNEYDSPTSQMQRLREAGLNENLVYGNGANAGSPAAIRSTDSDSTKTQSWSPHAPQVPDFIGSGLSSYVDVKNRELQNDLLKSQNTVSEQTALLTAANVKKTLAEIPNTEQQYKHSVFDLDQKSKMAPYSLQMADANLQNLYTQTRKTEADTQYTIANNERAALTNNMGLKEAAQRIISMRIQNTKIPAELANLKALKYQIETDTDIKQQDLRLKRLNINPSDPMYQRILGNVLQKASDVPKNIWGKFKDKWNKQYDSSYHFK